MTESLTTITAAPLLPWPLLAILAAAAAGAVALGLARRASGIWWRALGLAAVLAALVNPELVEESRELLPDIAVLVVDHSASQGIGERRAQADAALADLKAKLEAIPNLEARIVTVDASRAGAAGAAGSGTRLFAALDEALADVPRRRLAGVVMITDGQVHDAPADAASLGFDAPLHVLLSGRRGEADRRLVVERAPRYGIVGHPQSLSLRVEDAGARRRGGGLARVTVRQGDGPSKSHFVPVGASYEMGFTLDRAGPTVIELEVEDGPAELSRINNRAVVEVNGVRERLRVLLVSGEAHTGERVWRNLLKADPSVDLVHFTILRPPEKQDATPIRELALISFPIRELFQTKLNEFDLIIFDRFRQRGVVPSIYLENIARYVEQGGALLTAAGPAFATALSLYRTPLRQVLPARPTGEVIERGFRARLSDLGRRHPVTARLPGAESDPPSWGRWFRQIGVEVDHGTVLMEGADGGPILVLDRIGRGRVAQLLTDHMWLWARGFEGGGPQAELLRRLAHWLMKEPDLEEEDLRAIVRGNRIEIVRRSLARAADSVEVIGPSGARRVVALEAAADGRATAAITVDEPGIYRVSDGRLSAIGAVGEVNPLEFADLRASAETLEPLARATGGAVAWLADGAAPSVRMVRPGRDTAGRGWIGLKANQDYVVAGIRQAPLMPTWLVLLLSLGGLLLAWRAEGR
ncbi:MAG: hypothetical protein IIA00_00545 [Proteobacteria bacterium]|nr:hypothetical protein [Pseudomonadota bacterium]